MFIEFQFKSLKETNKSKLEKKILEKIKYTVLNWIKRVLGILRSIKSKKIRFTRWIRLKIIELIWWINVNDRKTLNIN